MSSGPQPSRTSGRQQAVGGSLLHEFAKTARQTALACAIAMLSLVAGVRPACAAPSLAQLYHTAWTVREGAPRNVNMFAQTRDGFLWLATDSGLYRFDGKSFDLYAPTSGDAFPVDSVRALATTADGGIWIGYARSGASFLISGHNTNYGEAAGLGRDSIYRIAIDRDDTVWAATGDGLKQLVGSEWKDVGAAWGYPEKMRTNELFVDREGTLWAYDGRLFYLTRGKHQFQMVPDLTARRIADAPNGTLWFASTTGQILAFDPISKTLRRDIPPISIRAESISVARDGSLWIATIDQGIFRLQYPEATGSSGDRPENSVEHFAKADGLSGNYSWAAIEDREGAMWIGTTVGIDQFRAAAFTEMPFPSNVTVQSAAIVNPDQIFYGASLFDAHSGRILVRAPSAIGTIYATYQDADNVLWFGGMDELWKLAGGVYTSIKLPANLGSGRRIQAIARDPEGALWVSIQRNGVYRLSDGEWSKATNLEAAADNLCMSIEVDSRGGVWFTFVKPNQVQVLRGDRVITYGEKDGIDVGMTTIIAEIDGHMIVGGSAGLDVQEGSRFRRLRLAGNEPITDVSGVLSQKNGDVWVNQASGILLIHAAAFENALAHSDQPMNFRIFDYLDGLNEASMLPSPIPTIYDGGNGFLYFLMRNRVLSLDTAHLPHNTLRPAVMIGSLVAGSKIFHNPVDALLASNIDRVTIHYSASSLLIPQRVKFRYRLEGFDKDWQEGNVERSAVYSRLPPGHFEFHIMASNNDGVWNEEGASVRLTVPPSFVQSGFFKWLCLALTVALIWIIYRMRLRQVTVQMRRRLYERLDERMQISRDLHDTFFQSIQGLLLRINTAASLLEKDDQARVILDDALKQSDRVMTEGREIMLDLRGEGGHAGALGDDFSSMGEDYKSTHPADFRVAVIGDPRPLHPIAYEEIYRFGREAIGNAFRHAHAETIEVDLYYERTLLRLRVRDDGLGIDPEILDRGYKAAHWGLPGMRERAKRLGGHVELWSRLNAGTEIELRVPSSAAYRNDARGHWCAWFTRGARKSEAVSTKS